MTYDFTRLSGPDFEEIVHDLLQVDWKTELEIFAGGRDGGIDLRRIDDDGLLIVQCKNYEGSGFSTLRGKMRDDELPKIRAKKPDRYVLVTSVDLTVGQKDELLKLLNPWVKTPGDIIGKKELTAKLGSHPQVVRRHHKLWLTSVAVMEKILIGAELLQTTAAVAKMVQKLNVYVETDALPRAVEILERHHVLIVSGEPGIGKSTLADMIMLDHIANGFQPAVIRGSLNEGRAIAAAGNPTIFYFDDFLGQTYLGDRPDFLGKREDADLVEFIHWVRTSKDHRFVLTTREHVLSEAMMRSERLRQGTLSDDKCLITVKDLNRAQRARILYNHLEFSSLPLEYKIEMLRGDFFLEVIDFERYSPRVIQWLSSYNRLQSVPVAEYQQHVRRLMANPLEIWRHAFTQELSQAARDILIALYSFTYRAYVDDAERCFDRLHETSIKRLNEKTKSGAFRSAMKELEGSFVTISRNGEVNFINPSIADFVASVLNDDPRLVIDLINSAIYFTQVSMLIEGAEPGGPLPNVMPRLKRNSAEVAASFDRLLEAPHLKWFDSKEGRTGYYVDMSPTSRASRLIKLREMIPEIGPVSHRMIASVAHDIEHNAIQLNEVQHLLKSAWGSDQALADMSEVIRSVQKGFRYAYAEDWLAIMDLRSEIGSKFDDNFPDAGELFQKYLDERLTDEIYDCDSVNAASNLEYVLERLQERHGAKVGYEITQVAERLADLEMNEGTRGSETSDDFFGTSHDKATETSDDAIKSMFGGLLG